MAYQSIWYFTEIPEKIIDIIEEDLEKYESNMVDSKLNGNVYDPERRNSKNAWIPTHHWIGGFVWHYAQRANRENFLYDIRNVDGENLQYTKYDVGEHYTWHNDAGITGLYKPQSVGNSSTELILTDYLNEKCEMIRKLSFVLQLSDHDSYEGGNLQLLDESGKSYFAPRKKGTMIFFDSRTQHRVLKVTKGQRKSIVGWVAGPRWK